MDAETGKILYEKNSETVLGIASMTKMMTEYLLLEAIKEGKVKWDQERILSLNFHKMSHDDNLSNVLFRAEGKYKVKRDYIQRWRLNLLMPQPLQLLKLLAGQRQNS